MARRSLKPQLNQIRAWVRQGRTDAWIAHQLEVTVQQIESFKRDNDLATEEGEGGEGFVEEVDLRAEDDALIAAELEAAEEEAGDEDEADEPEAADSEDEDEDGEERPAARRGTARRRGRRGGRGKRKGPLEGTFDHGEEGYGLWLDPAVQDDAVYAEHWAGHRPITVTVEEDQIVIKRAGDD